MDTHALRRTTALALALCGLVITGVASARSTSFVTISKDFVSPLFGVNAAPGDRLLVADAGAGPTELRRGRATLVTPLPGVTDVISSGKDELTAITSPVFGGTGGLYRIKRGTSVQIANVSDFETRVDPDADGAESDPFDLEPAGHGQTLVADAAGNSIVIVDSRGRIDWVATLPQHTVSTQPLKDAVGCPNGPPDVCNLPPTIDADPVPTSVAIGPDGAIYVGELTGFPATPGTSRIWRIKAGTRHAHCGLSSACSVVRTEPFTSIIDIQFAARGERDDHELRSSHSDDDDATAYVVEYDEASWLAVENNGGSAVLGGTVNRCEVGRWSWSCRERATRLPVPTGIAIDDGSLFTTLYSITPGMAQVARLR
jgi:hypothetical protein